MVVITTVEGEHTGVLGETGVVGLAGGLLEGDDCTQVVGPAGEQPCMHEVTVWTLVVQPVFVEPS